MWKFEGNRGKLGIRSRRWALAAGGGRSSGHGLIRTLFIANDYGVSELFFNSGGKEFREVGARTGIWFCSKVRDECLGWRCPQSRKLRRLRIQLSGSVLIQGNNLWVPRDGLRGRN
jgi:hypothetical protein